MEPKKRLQSIFRGDIKDKAVSANSLVSALVEQIISIFR